MNLTAVRLLLLLVLASCAPSARRAATWTIPPAVADTVRTERLADGVMLHRLVRTGGPLRAYVLDVDLRACLSVRSVKGAAVAAGRRTTSDLLSSLRPAFDPIAAVNADFFLFAPAGIPLGAHVEDGRLLSGPVARPVFAILPSGEPWIGELGTGVLTVTRTGRTTLANWNRPAAGSPGLVDARWGVALDSTITDPVWRLVRLPSDSSRYTLGLLGPTDSRLARGDTLLGVSLRGLAAIFRAGDTVQVSRALTPPVRHAVGGFPVLLRDSTILGKVDSVGTESFRGVNPRTAVGVGAGNRRLFVVVIDGRQAGVSVGASLRETAMLLRDLGARDAINLDGGGSSAMAIADALAASRVRLVNKPSDAAGERPVANALALVKGCSRR